MGLGHTAGRASLAARLDVGRQQGWPGAIELLAGCQEQGMVPSVVCCWLAIRPKPGTQRATQQLRTFEHMELSLLQLLGVGTNTLQGYLARKKPPPPLGPP